MSADISSVSPMGQTPPPTLYSPASKSNPMVFNRVPYAKRLHWLWLWNPDNNPHHVDCGVAVDTLAYYTSQQTQHAQRYYYGTFQGVQDAKRDLEVCLQVKSVRESSTDDAQTILQNRVSEREYEPEHVWRFREIPLKIETPQ